MNQIQQRFGNCVGIDLKFLSTLRDKFAFMYYILQCKYVKRHKVYWRINTLSHLISQIALQTRHASSAFVSRILWILVKCNNLENFLTVHAYVVSFYTLLEYELLHWNFPNTPCILLFEIYFSWHFLMIIKKLLDKYLCFF